MSGHEGGATILVVDDTPNELAMMSDLLRDLYHVKIANEGERALKIALSDAPPDLILLDVMMPGMDGHEVCRRLKAASATKDIPVIFLTAKSDVTDEIEGFRLGAADYIAKPISPPLVLARVKTQLQNKAALVILKDQNAHLEIEVEKRTRELAATHAVTVRTLAERENLLRELHHRTRNNMQVISGILDTEADISGDPNVAKVVKDTLERIMALSLVQKKLYDSQDLSRIDMREYFKELLDALTLDESFAEDRITLDCPEYAIPVLFDAAVPCGLVLRELVSNAIRHAYPRGEEGGIRVSLRKSSAGEVEFGIADDGAGLPPDFDFNRKDTLGMQLIRGLVESQLRGTVRFDTTRGVTCHVTFSDVHFSARV